MPQQKHLTEEGRGSDRSGPAVLSGAGAASFVQQALLMESVLAGRDDSNLWQVVVDAPDHLIDPARIGSIWQTLAARHTALRTVFARDDEGAVICQTTEIGTADPLGGAGESPEELSARERMAGIDPFAGPGWRVACCATGNGRIAMVWTVHAALVDSRSVRTVMEEFATLAGGGQLPDLPEFAPSQSDMEAAGALFARFGELPVTSGLLNPSVDADAPRMRKMSVQVPDPDATRLRALADAAGADLREVVTAVWSLVIARWTGAAEVCVGFCTGGRGSGIGADMAVGSFATFLPLRVGLGEADSFADLLDRVVGAARDLERTGPIGPAELRRSIGAVGRAPLWETVVAEDASLDGLFAGMAGSWRAELRSYGAAPVRLVLRDEAQVSLSLDHDPARLPDARARRLIEHVLHLLAQVAEGGTGQAIAALDMLGPEERARLSSLGAADTALPDAPPCIATRFESAAAAHPAAVAVVDAAGSVDFGRLDRRANALAARLVAAGIGEGQIVALHLPRGVAFVVALLAVWKAGGAVLPLDPEQSADWLRSLVRRAGAQVIVADSDAVYGEGVTVVHPDAGEAAKAPPRAEPDAGRHAYVIYTSGSSGEPKGVVGLQGALSAHADAVRLAYGLGPQDRVLQFAGLGFDVALEEIVPTLLAGAAVVTRDEEAAASVPAFLRFVAEGGVTVLNLPASFWHVLVQEMAERGLRLPPAVRLTIAGSERVSPRLLRLWQEVAPGCCWMNGYGPTETTVTATAWSLDAGAVFVDPVEDVPIGRPLAHARVQLRAVDGTPTPEGGTGVLWIGGPAVAGGYLGNPSRTAEVFRQDVALGRVYRTGDLARWRADGMLAFLGRADRQVKLRGHRIDLHQVEAVLGALPAVRQVHVAVERDRLLAWVVAREGTGQALERQAARALPDYAVPHVIMVAAMPVKPNGKVDPAQLPRPQALAAVAEGDVDPLAVTIAACMAAVLAVPTVGVDTSFHDIGGDSLLALRLVSRVEAETGRVLRATDLYRHPTARSLAVLLRLGVGGTRHVVSIQPQGTRVPFYAIHVLGRNEHLFRPLAAAMGPDFPMFGISIGIPERLEDVTVERVARVYFDEIQTHQPDGPVALGAVSMATYFAFELAQMLMAAGREVRVLALLDADGPGGRPEVRGMQRLVVHLGQVRKHGLAHLRRIAASRLRSLRGKPDADTDAGEFEGFVDFVEANVRAVDAYRPQRYAGRLTIFRAADSFWDSPQALASGLGWDVVAGAGYDLIDLPGSHLSILDPGNVDVLATHLRRLLG